jgi:hypothetical protein
MSPVSLQLTLPGYRITRWESKILTRVFVEALEAPPRSLQSLCAQALDMIRHNVEMVDATGLEPVAEILEMLARQLDSKCAK